MQLLERSIQCIRERSCSVVECLTRERGARVSSLMGVTALCPSARHINPSLVLVQPRKTCPFITERYLMGHKESNQINKLVMYIVMYRNVCYTFIRPADKSA